MIFHSTKRAPSVVASSAGWHSTTSKTSRVYARFLRQNPAEVHTLFKELADQMSPVSSAMQKLSSRSSKTSCPVLLADKPDNYIYFRVMRWQVAPAAKKPIPLRSRYAGLMDEMHKHFKVQIFATDLDEGRPSTAPAAANYSAGIEQDVTPERLLRFFTP